MTPLHEQFGVAVTLPDQTEIAGLFDEEYVGVGDIPIESSGPAVTCRTSDLSDVTHGASLVIEAITYTIRAVQPDGTGITVLRLEKA